jgi:hypothetical protein
LSSPLALPSTGNAVSGFFDYESPLSTTLVNRDFWASFLVAHTGPNDQTYMGLTQSAIPFGTPPLVAFGIRLGQYGIFDSGSGFTASAVPFTPAGSTDFLLAHIRPVGPFYQVDLFVNPSSLAFPSVTVNVPPVFYDAIENQNQAEFTSDEVRLGDTAFDAGFVPAPGAGTLVMLAGLIACRRRR